MDTLLPVAALALSLIVNLLILSKFFRIAADIRAIKESLETTSYTAARAAKSLDSIDHSLRPQIEA